MSVKKKKDKLFTIGEEFGPLRAVEVQLLARALKNAYYYKDMGTPKKKTSKKTGFKCNHYHDKFLPQCRTLLTACQIFQFENCRNFFYENDKYQLIVGYFLKDLGIDPEGYLMS